MSQKIYDMIAERIVEEIEKGDGIQSGEMYEGVVRALQGMKTARAELRVIRDRLMGQASLGAVELGLMAARALEALGGAR